MPKIVGWPRVSGQFEAYAVFYGCGQFLCAARARPPSGAVSNGALPKNTGNGATGCTLRAARV